MARVERMKRWVSIGFAVVVALAAVGLLLASATLPQQALRAADSSALPHRERHQSLYLILERAENGRIRLLSARPVNLSTAPQGMTERELQSRLRYQPRDAEVVALVLEDAAGQRVFQTAVRVPTWERGEFHGEDDGRIDGRYFRAGRSAFVARVPALTSARLLVEDEQRQLRDAFYLDRLPAPQATIAVTGTITDHIGTLGPPENRVDLLIVGEGYAAGQSAAFKQAASKFVDRFFSISPYSSYRNYVNVHTLYVPSPQAGADHPPYQNGCTSKACCADTAMLSDPLQGQFVTTAFDAAFCANQIQRMISVNSSKVFAAATAVPDWDQIAVLVNDPTYGGMGGTMLVVSTEQLAVQIAQHEYGHTFAGLADEYTLPVPGFPACSDTFGPLCEPNVTDQNIRSQIKWRPWIADTTPIPTEPQFASQYANVVGLFEGARYTAKDMYRSGQDCIMRTLGKPFCQVPAQSYVFRLYEGGWGDPDAGISLIEPGSISPAQTQIRVWHPQSVPFAAQILKPADKKWVKINWELDDKVVSSAGEQYLFRSQEDQVGETVSLAVSARDETPLVHPQMTHPSLTSENTWLIDVGAAPRNVSVAGPQQGRVNRTYTFSATVNLSSTVPLSYTWQATDLSTKVVTGSLQSAVTFRWTDAGQKEVTVTAENGGGEVVAARTIAIYVPLSSVSITGPEVSTPGAVVRFRAIPRPADVSLPVSYTWTPEPLSGQHTAFVEYMWTSSGVKRVTLEATDLAGTTIKQDRDILILPRRAFLPLVRRR